MRVFRAAILFLLSLISVANAQAQTARPKNGSFAISTGSSFSASSARPNEETPAERTEPTNSAVKAISSDLDEVLRLVKDNHVSGAKLYSQRLVAGAIASMLGQLDPHSNYYDPSEYQELVDDQQGHYSGIGTTISSYSMNGVADNFVLTVSKNTPADKAGLRFGDRIIEIDGKPVSGMDSLDVRNRLRGPIGTSARVSVEHADGTQLRNIVIRREMVPQKSVTNSLLLEGGIGYIALTEGFGYTTFAEFNSAFVSLKQKGMSSADDRPSRQWRRPDGRSDKGRGKVSSPGTDHCFGARPAPRGRPCLAIYKSTF
jgi:carboxyl-terminal processing protease